MSGYQRMVSYLYRYEKGAKEKNVGYARIESRNDQCRITVRFQDRITVSPRFSFFIQKEEGMLTIPAGKLMRNGSIFTGRVEISRTHIAGSEYSFEQMDGIYISGPEDVFYATTWKDIVISEQGISQKAETFEIPEQIFPKTTEASGNPEQTVRKMIEASENPEPTLRKTTEASENLEQISRKTTENAGEPEYINSVPDTPQMEASSVPAEECDRDVAKQGRRQQGSKNRSQEFCEKMLRIFPKMYPFEAEGMGECVRIDLKDIGNLPVAYWSLAGNPFLLRGYYCYRHLIFTRMDGGGYAVGVPGIYSEDNGRWAEECRMTGFQPLSRVKDRHGAFGYWMYRIS